ncbi:ATP-dependent DNA helicase RecG [Anseongella ginsenosidimutans]|uniref:ATP-dependent DNA helicase RecG n=1 Tax=Anseongella ginsenosidimutans TaxID=496056 RepID=A0A4R3KNR9_9SPHI|nr:ATP-dependent DNA helicase RecG [Anseongella ginsenosidimutans]TCS85699.1 ATP-dependent DNA helicase RecG [Anseongella ginsenosidimutans]
MASQILLTPVDYLKGVGPSRADVLKKELSVFTWEDLLLHYPFRYIDKTRFYTIGEINADMQYIQLAGTVTHKEMAGSGRSKRLVARFEDETGRMELIWFRGLKWIDGYVKTGQRYVVFEKPTFYNGKVSMVHPEMELLSENKKEFNTSLQPVYPSTEKLKKFALDSKGIMRLQHAILAEVSGEIPETLPAYLLEKHRLPSKGEAIRHVHFPPNEQALNRAIARLKFEELFFIQLKLLYYKQVRTRRFKGIVFDKVGDQFNTFYNEKLPFELTGAQKRVLKEIRKDTLSGFQMNRLLQGDVGSGKTVIALMSMLLAIDNGWQACMMAPTELLAMQHFNSVKKLLEGMDLQAGLLTGSTPMSERKVIFEQLENGTLPLLIGTHALIEESVQFRQLGLAVVDEQHRFGVEQRAKLWKKSRQVPHVLVMTATPIPRTLAMTVYGDLDVSVIDELPAGRKPIITTHRYESGRLRVLGFLKEEIARGRQVYIVYPLIEESEKLDLLNLMEGYDQIVRAFPRPQYQVSIVHGKMKPAEKDFEMQRFLKGETQLMVATTVIEVGVDVPNASVMVIENSERFGLSQLHQLRGRVGRGAEQSYCILMTGNKLSKEAKVRLETMVRTNDGFEIAETDLKLRGPGDLQGTRQSGMLDLRLANLAKDQQILREARECVQELLGEDPELTLPENQVLKNFFLQQHKKAAFWEKIS